MSITSLVFAGFVLVVLCLYYLLPGKSQKTSAAGGIGHLLHQLGLALCNHPYPGDHFQFLYRQKAAQAARPRNRTIRG